MPAAHFPDRLRALAGSLSVRLAAILLAGLLAVQGVSLWLQTSERSTAVSQVRGLGFADRIAEVVRLLEAGERAQRPATIAALQSDDLRIVGIDADQVSPNVPRGQIQAALSARLGSAREVRSLGGMAQGMGPGMGMAGGMGGMVHGGAQRSFDVRLNDGDWVRITASRSAEPDAPALPNALLVQLGASLVVVIVAVLLAVRLATRPLQQLARAADTLGGDLDAPPLAETGLTETRRAAQAFNRMQERIRRLVDERARALAAVSHDLRTPLTRLRLRSEFVDDHALREQMGADLDAMAAMIDATLDYLRGLQDSETPRPIDMDALLQSLADDARVVGREIVLDGHAHAPYVGRLDGLRRALQNLIDNAFKYGIPAQGVASDSHVRLRIDDGDAEFSLSVEDDGPGLPAAELERVTQPYYRPDAARRRETGGVGLGLAIVKDIARLHAGELRLANRPTGGLVATLVLPRRVV